MSLCFVIVGMHRSGSSLVARIFYEMGVYLGEELMEPDFANLEGFYENMDFVRLNNTLMSEVDGDWNRPREWLTPDQRAKELIELHERKLWGWKDNRTVFTWKAYEPFVKNPCFVVVRRDKKAVIKSLKETHISMFPLEHRTNEYMGWLYDYHYSTIDEIAKPHPRIDVRYEDLVENKFWNPDMRHF